MTRDLSTIERDKIYHISAFGNETSSYAEKLRKMGFIQGTQIQLAPVRTADPLVFQIRGSRIALRRKEARHIIVEEV